MNQTESTTETTANQQEVKTVIATFENEAGEKVIVNIRYKDLGEETAMDLDIVFAPQIEKGKEGFYVGMANLFVKALIETNEQKK